MSLTKEVVAAVRREIREAGLLHVADPYLPPPCDRDAQAEILSAILDGHVSHSDLAPLAKKHFFGDVHAAIWEASCECSPGDREGIMRALLTRGWVERTKLELELDVLEKCQPWICLPRLRDHAARIIALWARREVIEACDRASSDLRRGAVDAYEARAQIEERLRRVLG